MTPLGQPAKPPPCSLRLIKGNCGAESIARATGTGPQPLPGQLMPEEQPAAVEVSGRGARKRCVGRLTVAFDQRRNGARVIDAGLVHGAARGYGLIIRPQ